MKPILIFPQLIKQCGFGNLEPSEDLSTFQIPFWLDSSI